MILTKRLPLQVPVAFHVNCIGNIGRAPIQLSVVVQFHLPQTKRTNIHKHTRLSNLPYWPLVFQTQKILCM